MLVIGYYTIDSPYVEEAQRWANSLIRTGHSFNLMAIDDKGDWDQNTAEKPGIISFILSSSHTSVLYVDVDAVFHANCDDYFNHLAALEYDFACHWLEGKRLLSGTLWFNNTRPAKELLSHWINRNFTKQVKGDYSGGGQRNLWEVISEQKTSGLRMHKLPGRYCYAFRRPECYPPDEPRIIEHTLASRENRGDNKGKTDPIRRQRIKEIDCGIGTW